MAQIQLYLVEFYENSRGSGLQANAIRIDIPDAHVDLDCFQKALKPLKVRQSQTKPDTSMEHVQEGEGVELYLKLLAKFLAEF